MLPVPKPFRPEEWQHLAETALAQAPCFHGRNLAIEAESDALVLRGVVKTVFQKRLAERTVRAVAPLIPIVNEIDVAEE